MKDLDEPQEPQSLVPYDKKENSLPRSVKKTPSAPVLQTQKRAVEREEREKRIRRETAVYSKQGQEPRMWEPSPSPEQNTEMPSKAQGPSKLRKRVKQPFQPTSTVSAMAKAREQAKAAEMSKAIQPSSSQQTDTRSAIGQAGRPWASQTSLASPKQHAQPGSERDEKKIKSSSLGRPGQSVNRSVARIQKAAIPMKGMQLDTAWQQRKDWRRDEASPENILVHDFAPSLPSLNSGQVTPVSTLASPKSFESSRSKFFASEPRTSITTASPSSTRSKVHGFSPLSPLQQEFRDIPWPETKPREPGHMSSPSSRKSLPSLATTSRTRSDSNAPKPSTAEPYKGVSNVGIPTQDSRISRNDKGNGGKAKKTTVGEFKRIIGLDGTTEDTDYQNFGPVLTSTVLGADRVDGEPSDAVEKVISGSGAPAENVASDEKPVETPEAGTFDEAMQTEEEMSSVRLEFQLRGNAKRFDTPLGFKDEPPVKRAKREATNSGDDGVRKEKVAPGFSTLDGTCDEPDECAIHSPTSDGPLLSNDASSDERPRNEGDNLTRTVGQWSSNKDYSGGTFLGNVMFVGF